MNRNEEILLGRDAEEEKEWESVEKDMEMQNRGN